MLLLWFSLLLFLARALPVVQTAVSSADSLCPGAQELSVPCSVSEGAKAHVPVCLVVDFLVDFCTRSFDWSG